MNRREFCRKLSAVGGTILFAPLIKACTSAPEATPTARPQATVYPSATSTSAATLTPHPSATAEPTTTPPPTATNAPDPTATSVSLPEAGLGRVALVKTGDRAQGVRRAIELLGLNAVRGNRVLLKPNFNSADAAPASTHADVLSTLLLQLNEMGARAITVGERSGMGDTRHVMEQKGLFDLADRFGFDTVVFDELGERDWVVRQSGDFHWQNGFAVPRILLDTECVVQTCNLKTHRYGGHFTLSLKNSVGFAAKATSSGGYNYMTELHSSPYQRHMIAEINTAYTPSLIVVDGVEAFVNGGPAQGKKVRPEVVLAGTDRVAVDAVGVAILRLWGTTPEVSQGKVFEQAQIAQAVALGLGVDAPAKIDIVTGDAESEAYAARIRQLLL